MARGHSHGGGPEGHRVSNDLLHRIDRLERDLRNARRELDDASDPYEAADAARQAEADALTQRILRGPNITQCVAIAIPAKPPSSAARAVLPWPLVATAGSATSPRITLRPA